MKTQKYLLLCLSIVLFLSCASQKDSITINQLENLPDNTESQKPEGAENK